MEEFIDGKPLDKCEWGFLPFLSHYPILPERNTTQHSLLRLSLANRMLIRRHFIISKLITHQEELVAHLKHQYKIIYWDSRKTWDAFCRVVKKYEKINAWSDVVPNKKITHWADPQKYGRATPEVSACKA